MFQASKLAGACIVGCVLGAVSPAPFNSANAFQILHHFRGVGRRVKDGEYPNTRMIMDGAGNLFGTTLTGGSGGAGTVFRISERDGSFKERVIYSFPAGGADGAYPEAGVIMGALPGTLDGTTSGGGGSLNCTGGCGTVYQLSRSHGGGWTPTKLHSFQGSDGAYPAGGLVRDQAGNLYGTTEIGGTGSCENDNGDVIGCGSVFKLEPDGTELLVYSFLGGNGDGAQPSGALVMDLAGNLYGTTQIGGTGSCENENGNVIGCGTVFKLEPNGTEAPLYSFQGDSEGASPYGGAALYGGKLYGTTSAGGGAGCGGSGCGTVFELTLAGAEMQLYSFCTMQNCSDGSVPYSSLVLDQKGNIYGTASSGGVCRLCGTIFKLGPGGTGYAVLRSFCFRIGGNCEGGDEPYAGLTLHDGQLYGTATLGGHQITCPGGCGTVFGLQIQ